MRCHLEETRGRCEPVDVSQKRYGITRVNQWNMASTARAVLFQVNWVWEIVQWLHQLSAVHEEGISDKNSPGI